MQNTCSNELYIKELIISLLYWFWDPSVIRIGIVFIYSLHIWFVLLGDDCYSWNL
jgi:hypothetical protein